MRYIKIIALLLVFSSCATKVPFTSDIQNKHKFSEETLKKVQFYTSEEIVLYLVKQDGDVVVNEGKIIFRNDEQVQKIVIKKNTPCVLEEIVEQNKFLFSFEYGKDRVLLFGNNHNGYYSLMAKEWKNKVGEVSYGNKTYLTANGNVYLNVKMKELNRVNAKQRTVKGRKI